MLGRGGAAKPTAGAGGGAEADRRHKRHAARGVSCALGTVMDLSAGGMCLETPGRPTMKEGEATKIKLQTSAGTELVPVRVCWIKRNGFGLSSLLGKGGHQVGLKFMGLAKDQADRLAAIAKYGFLPEAEAEEQAATAEEELKKKVADAAAAAQAGRRGGGAPGPDAAKAPAPGVMAQIIRDGHLKVLGLDDSADMDAIRRAYRAQVRRVHPDVNKDPQSLENFMALQTAYDALKREPMSAA